MYTLLKSCRGADDPDDPMFSSGRYVAALALMAALTWTLPGGALGEPPELSLPAALDSFLTDQAQGSAADREALLAGHPVTKLLDADPMMEVAVFGAVWVDAQPALYIAQVKNIEQFERGGGIRTTRLVGDPPRATDFAAMNISEQDFEDLEHCEIGSCALKLDADALRTLRASVDWRKPTARDDANAVFRNLAAQYVQGYLEGGNARLAVYRDSQRPTFVEAEFRSMIEGLPRLAAELPDLKRYLLEYPAAELPNSTNFLYWQEVQFGLKPTIRISHLVIQERRDATIVASKMLYASHYFWTALELRVLLPDPARGRGFWFVTVNRSRSDGLSGFGRALVRRRVRDEVQKGMGAALDAVKTKLESIAP
jgi:hypothetical protein